MKYTLLILLAAFTSSVIAQELPIESATAAAITEKYCLLR